MNSFNYSFAQKHINWRVSEANKPVNVFSCQFNKNILPLSYGIDDKDLKFANLKLHNQREYLKKHNFYSFTGEIKSLFDISMSANHSHRYYSEVCNRVNTLQDYSFNVSLKPVFLTITLNGCFRKALNGDFSTFKPKDRKMLPYELKYKLENNQKFTIPDLVYFLNHCWNLFIMRIHRHFKGIEKTYIRVFEPHKKDGVPHIHALLNIPEYAIKYIFQTFKDIFYAPQNLRTDSISKEQRLNGEINGFQTTLDNATGYVLKYINKTFINFNENDVLNELNAWYVIHKVRKFITSRAPIPLWIYRKINFFKKNYYNFIYDFKINDINTFCEWSLDDKYFKFVNYDTQESIIYEDGILKHCISDKILHSYEKPGLKDFKKPFKQKEKISIKRKNPYIRFKWEVFNDVPFSKMNNHRLTNYYLFCDKQNMNTQRLGYLENEMFKRGLSKFTKQNKLHDLNDIDALKCDFAERGLQELEF
ncbi:replication endonuclease [Campylobacter sputorum]|uniref:replication endonuclease n=1 Tax=Campylobacter sputorum TaxID=206 RepID=UPI001E602069|nr:replication endonuclease [Campylobacter sputorum]